MNIWKRYSMRVSKNWVKFNKMFTLSPWGVGSNELGRHPLSRVIEAVCGETRTYGVAGIQIISATLMDEWREVANC